jgi:hypothetical protein
MTNSQRAATMCASFPYPLDANGVRAAIRRAMASGDAEAVPWAGPPWV